MSGEARLPEPRVAPLLRPRLLPASFDELPAVTVLDAGAGTGKSVLLMQYADAARNAGFHVAHVYMRPMEAGIFEVYRRVRASLEEQGILNPGAIPQDVPIGAHDLAGTDVRLLDRKLVVIVDNVVAKPNEHPSLPRAFANMLESLPQVHAVLAGRDLAEFGADEYRLRVSTEMVDGDSLAFTAAEIEALARDRRPELGAEQSGAWAAAVYRVTEGWPLAVSAALASPPSSDWGTGDGSGLSHRTFARRHVEKYASELSHEDLEALLLISVLPEVTNEVMARVDGGRSTDHFARLMRLSDSLLRRREDPQGEIRFSPHRLLRAELRRHSVEHLGSDAAFAALRNAAAELRSREPGLALDASVHAQDWHAVNEILHESLTEDLSRPNGPVQRMLSVLPAPAQERYPLLGAVALLEEIGRSGGHVVRYGARIHRAEHRLRVDSAKTGMVGVMAATARMRLASLLGDDGLVADMVDRTDELVAELSFAERSRAERALLAVGNQIAAAELRLLRFDAVFERCQRILERPRSPQLADAFAHAASLQALSAALRGDMGETGFLVERFEAEHLSDPSSLRLVHTGAMIAKALHLLEQDRVPAAAHVVRELQRRSVDFNYWAPLAWVQAHLYERLLGADEALSRLERLLELRYREQTLLSAPHRRLAETLARLQYQTGRLTLDPREELRNDFVGLHQARAAGHPERAVAIAASVARKARAEGDVRRTVEALLLKAEAKNWLRDPGAESARASAVRLAEEHQLSLPLRVVPARMRAVDAAEGLPEELESSRPGIKPLSPAEIRSLRQVAISGNATAAAKELFLSPYTVRAQLKSCYKKLGVSNRAEAIRAAARLGLLG